MLVRLESRRTLCGSRKHIDGHSEHMTIGYPLLIISAVAVNTNIVRSVRWRRQYELCIDRLIQTSLGVSSLTTEFIRHCSTE
jgi:hypothetical protein